ASRQVMRSVSADFCASAGAAIASVVQAASSAPRSQVSDRIYLVLSIPKRRWRQQLTTPVTTGTANIRHRGTEATRMPSHWLRSAAAPGDLYRIGEAPDLSVIDGREQPFQETVDGL